MLSCNLFSVIFITLRILLLIMPFCLIGEMIKVFNLWQIYSVFICSLLILLDIIYFIIKHKRIDTKWLIKLLNQHLKILININFVL